MGKDMYLRFLVNTLNSIWDYRSPYTILPICFSYSPSCHSGDVNYFLVEGGAPVVSNGYEWRAHFDDISHLCIWQADHHSFLARCGSRPWGISSMTRISLGYVENNRRLVTLQVNIWKNIQYLLSWVFQHMTCWLRVGTDNVYCICGRFMSCLEKHWNLVGSSSA